MINIRRQYSRDLDEMFQLTFLNIVQLVQESQPSDASWDIVFKKCKIYFGQGPRLQAVVFFFYKLHILSTFYFLINCVWFSESIIIKRPIGSLSAPLRAREELQSLSEALIAWCALGYVYLRHNW